MEKDKLRDLKQELTDWVTAYKDATERNALAENPDESAEYLISLIEPLIEEAKREERERIIGKYLEDCESTPFNYNCKSYWEGEFLTLKEEK